MITMMIKSEGGVTRWKQRRVEFQRSQRKIFWSKIIGNSGEKRRYWKG
jgi:hypothetical protein